MERKLIKQGKGGLTIYLPKKWLDSKGLSDGQSIDVDMKDDALIIRSKAHQQETTIAITDENRHGLRHLLTHLYRNGFDRITFTQVTAEDITIIRKLTHTLLLGFDVTDAKGKTCVLENISEPAEEKYDVILRRVFLLIGETIAQIKEKAAHKDIETLRDQQDKLSLFCRRILVKEQHDRNTLLEWELLTFLMHIEHALYYLSAHLVKQPLQKDESFTILLDDLDAYFSLFSNAYFRKDTRAVAMINKLKDKYQYGLCIELMQKGKNIVAYSYLREIFRLIQIATSPIISMQVREKTLEGQNHPAR